MKKTLFMTFALLLAGSLFAQMPRTPSPEGAEVYIISPKDGDVVEGPVTVLFGLKGMGIAPAGIDVPNTGHHHLLIDAKSMPSMDMPMPASEHLIHYGKGQTEATLELEPGEHTFQLVFGDKLHIPHDPVVKSEMITITVK